MQDNSPVQKPEKKVRVCVILGVVGIVLILAMAVSVATCASNYKSLKASVKFDGTQFVFQNSDDFDWNDVRFLLNTDYKYNLPTVAANSGFAIQGVDFAKDDGTKFDPTLNAPTDFIVTAKVLHAQWSSWFYRFN